MMNETRLASAVASAYINRIAFLPNVPARTQDTIVSGLLKAIKLGLQPYPSNDPQGELSKIAGLLMRNLKDSLDSASLSNRDAHSFLGSLISSASVRLRDSDLELAMMQVVDFDPDLSITGRLESVLEEMVHSLAADISRGAVQGQKKAVRLLQRQGLEDWEALQVLANLTEALQVTISISGAQFNSLLDSYLSYHSRAARVAGPRR